MASAPVVTHNCRLTLTSELVKYLPCMNHCRFRGLTEAFLLQTAVAFFSGSRSNQILRTVFRSFLCTEGCEYFKLRCCRPRFVRIHDASLRGVRGHASSRAMCRMRTVVYGVFAIYNFVATNHNHLGRLCAFVSPRAIAR